LEVVNILFEAPEMENRNTQKYRSH